MLVNVRSHPEIRYLRKTSSTKGRAKIKKKKKQKKNNTNKIEQSSVEETEIIEKQKKNLKVVNCL